MAHDKAALAGLRALASTIRSADSGFGKLSQLRSGAENGFQKPGDGVEHERCRAVILTAGVFGDRRLISASGTIIALVVVGQLIRPVNQTLLFYTDPILLEFVLGILVFKTWNQTRETGQGLAPLAVLAAGCLLLFLQWERPVGDMRMLFWGVPAAAILYGGLGTLTFRSALLARLGDWSYALYLTHIFVISLYIKHIISRVTFIELPWPIHYLIIVMSACATAALFYVFVERPLSRWALRKMRGGGTAASGKSHPELPDRPASQDALVIPPLSNRP